jgi:biopolymer transport protein ExbD
MAMNKNTVRRFHFNPSKLYLFVAIAIGAGYALFFALFMIGFREAFILVTNKSTYGASNILTDSEIVFYNFFLGFMACLVGGSKIIEILLQAQQQPRIDTDIRNTVNTHQSGLLWFSMFWLSKASMMFILVFPRTDTSAGFYLFDYWYFFLIGLFVLFYSQWNKFSVAFVNGRRIRNWFGLIYLMFSIAISLFSFVLFSGGNRIIRDHSILYNYEIETPKSEVAKKLDYSDRVFSLYLGKPKRMDKDTLCLVGADSSVAISIETAKESLYELKSCLDCEPIVVQLVFSKKAKMSEVNNVFKMFQSNNQRKIFLSTNKNDIGLPLGLAPRCMEDVDTLSGYPYIWQDCKITIPLVQELVRKKIFVSVKLSNNTILFNEKKIDSHSLYDSMVQQYNEYDSLTGVLYTFDDESNYEKFIQVVDALFKANIYKKTEFAATLGEKYSFQDTYEKNRQLHNKVSHRYPLNIAFHSEVEFLILKERYPKH